MTRTGALLTGWLPLVVVVAAQTLYVVGLAIVYFRKRKTGQLAANLAFEKGKIARLEPQVKELSETNESLGKNLESAILSLGEARQQAAQAKREAEESRRIAAQEKSQNQAITKHRNIIESRLQSIAWVEKMVNNQAMNISDHVVIESITAVELKLTGPRLQLKLAFEIKNNSLFDIAINREDIGGHIAFRGQAYREEICLSMFDDATAPAVESLGHLQSKYFVVRQPLRGSDAEEIERARGEALADFDLRGIKMTVRGSKDFPQVEPKPLKLQKAHERLDLEKVLRDT